MSPTASSLGGGAVIFSNPYLLGRREEGGPFPSHLASGARSVPAWARRTLFYEGGRKFATFRNHLAFQLFKGACHLDFSKLHPFLSVFPFPIPSFKADTIPITTDMGSDHRRPKFYRFRPFYFTFRPFLPSSAVSVVCLSVCADASDRPTDRPNRGRGRWL